MVGSKRFELSTSSVSRKRSNQLSYEPVFSTTWLFLGGSSEPLLRTRGEARSDTKGFYHRAPVHPERDVSVATLELYDRAWPTEQMVKRIGELRDGESHRFRLTRTSAASTPISTVQMGYRQERIRIPRLKEEQKLLIPSPRSRSSLTDSENRYRRR